MLVAVAGRITGCVRPEDTVARLGGDEFAIVLGGGPRTARGVATRVLAALADPVSGDGRSHVVSASIGIADTITAERDADTLLRNADLAMYLAKAQGKQRLVVYVDGMAQQARGKRTWSRASRWPSHSSSSGCTTSRSCRCAATRPPRRPR